MEQLEVSSDTRVYSTRLKHKLLDQFPDMQAHNKGRNVLMLFEEDVGAALATACGLDCDSDAVHLARPAQIVRKKMFKKPTHLMASQKDTKRNMFFHFSGPCEHDSRGSQHQRPDARQNPCSTCSCLNIEVQQLQALADTWHIIRQHQAQHCTGDTVPTYIGKMLHAHTCKRALIDRLSHLTVFSNSQLRWRKVSANSFTESMWYAHQQCMAKFTTAAIDNIDHNPQFNYSKGIFPWYWYISTSASLFCW